ncbi:DUF5522 domain-containing protein [Negadavirga shengliensis]|uniref:DUF5522 domain-containing protein n=1 Tax=Negadavirga shengliensis TaxID=1389218 RepID=A0ABV9SY96_9BACT
MPKNKSFPDPKHLKEGVHYYFEGPYMVFTAAYHLMRGTCCGSGCRHCPFPKNKK